MKLILSANEKEKSSMLDLRFGRCKYFAIVDLETNEWNYIENKGAYSSGGAGIAASQQVIDQAADVLITGNLGPNAFEVLEKSNMKVLRSGAVKLEEAILLFKENKLEPLTQVGKAHHGMQ